ncbi:hypothetical protein ACERNI_05140 [Camelimonas sp. ID_303_24]
MAEAPVAVADEAFEPAAGAVAADAPEGPAGDWLAGGGAEEGEEEGDAGGELAVAPAGSTIEDAVAFRSMVVGWRNDLPVVDLLSPPVEPPAAPPAPGEPFPVEELSVIVRRSP